METLKSYVHPSLAYTPPSPEGSSASLSAAPLPPPAGTFHWTPLDLSEAGTWWQQRAAILWEVAATCADPEAAYADGLRVLKVPRNNYDSDGPCP
jgi:hypothetical protein